MKNDTIMPTHITTIDKTNGELLLMELSKKANLSIILITKS